MQTTPSSSKKLRSCLLFALGLVLGVVVGVVLLSPNKQATSNPTKHQLVEKAKSNPVRLPRGTLIGMYEREDFAANLYVDLRQPSPTVLLVTLDVKSFDEFPDPVYRLQLPNIAMDKLNAQISAWLQDSGLNISSVDRSGESLVVSLNQPTEILFY